MVFCDCFDRVGVDDGGAVARERLAVDRHFIDDRVIQVVEVRAVDNTIVIKVDRAILAAGIANALAAVRLIGHPDQAAAAAQADRVLRITVKTADVCLAVHPAGPGDLKRALRIRVLRGQARRQVRFILIGCRIPCLHVHIHAVCRRALRRVHPDADFCGFARNINVTVTAIADVEIDVGCAVVGAVVVVELHRALAETDLTALLFGDDLQVAAAVIIQCTIWPQEIIITIVMEHIYRAHIRNQRKFDRRLILGILGNVTAVRVRAIIGKFIKNPVIVRALLAIALRIWLKVEQCHRQLADLNVDLCAQRLVIGILHLDRGIHGLRTVAGHERVAIHVPNIRIRHTFRLGRNGPVEVAIFIDDIQTIALGNQAKVRGGTEVHRGLRAAERKRGNVRDLHSRRALDGAIHKQTGRHIALVILRGREQTIGIDRAALSICDRPGHILRELSMAAVGVHTDGRELDLAVGRIDRIVRREGGMIEHAVALRRGDQQQRARDRALHTVGRAVADLEVRGALALGGAGSGTAAVEIDRIHHALRIQERNHLIDRHADRVRALAAVGHKGHDRAVRLDADAVARHEVRIPVVAGLSILDQIKRAGNRFQNVGAVRPGVTDGIGTVLQNRKIRFPRAAVARLDDIALHDQVTGRLRRLHVVVVAIHGHDDVAAGGLSIVSRLQRRLFQAPGHVGCLVLTGRRCAVFCIITVIRSLESCLRTRCDRRHKAGDLRIAFLSIQKDIRFRHAVNQRVIRLTNDDLVTGGLDGVYGVHSQRLRGNECQRHQDSQHKSPSSVCESGRFHDSHQLLFCVFLSKFVSSICKKRRDEVFPSLLCALGTYDLSISNRSPDRKTFNWQ